MTSPTEGTAAQPMTFTLELQGLPARLTAEEEQASLSSLISNNCCNQAARGAVVVPQQPAQPE
jgi:hypothetical protein